MTRFEALQLCREIAGTQELMANALGVSQPTVSNWLRRSKQMPAEHVLQAELAFGVSRHDLRPDIYPRESMVDRSGTNRFKGIDAYAFPRAARQPLAIEGLAE